MEIYGQTELTVTIGNFVWMEPRPGSMGKPNAMYDLDIVDENGDSCAPGETGEIVVYTDKEIPTGMFLGYYRMTSLRSASGIMAFTIRETLHGRMRTVTSGMWAAQTT